MKKKKKSEQIKIGSLITVLFIVSTNMGYGIEIAEDFINNEIIHEEDKDGVTSIAPNIKIKNNGIISSITDSIFAYSGSGIKGQIDTQVMNTGVISGIGKGGSKAHYSGNGVQTSASIINSGIITGISTSGSQNAGNGIINNTSSVLINKGAITGTILNGGANSGNGFYGNSSVTNIGIILGESNNGSYTGNGTVFKNEGEVANSGIISGFSTSSFSDSGNGIISVKYQGGLDNAINSGIIKGSNQAIKGDYTSLKNFGILAGKTIVDSGNTFTNNGITVTLNTDGSGNVTKIDNGTGGEVTLADGSIKTVLNGSETGAVAGTNTTIIVPPGKLTADSYLLASNLINEGDNLIINGGGVDKGALIVDQNTILKGSIVNGYNTALYVESGTLTATDTIFNGGGLKNDVAVIRGSEGNNEVFLLGNSIINGGVDLGSGDDTLLLTNTTQINGALNGGTGDEIEGDTLGLGKKIVGKTTSNLNILHNISGFENINTNGDVTLFETIAVTDTVNITLESGNLTLRVNPTKTVVEDGKTKIIGHALYGNTGNLTSTGGNLVIGLNGLGADTIVSMGGTTISSETNNSWWKDTDHIKTNSLVLDGKLSADGSDINITLKENIPLEPSEPVIPLIPLEPSEPIIPLIPLEPSEPVIPLIPLEPSEPIIPLIPLDPSIPVDPPVIDGVLYEKLNQVYKSIASSGEIGTLAKTTLLDDKTYNESLGGLLTALDQIYANNPYAYTLKSSRDSLKLFEDNMSYLTIKPKINEWIVQGKAIYTGVINDNEASGKNYYGFDTGHRNYKTTTNTVGGIATAEYGLTDKTSVGFVLGGNNQDIKFKGTSEIDGTSMYLGSFAKTEINNFKFITGLGYQYTSADVNRGVSNDYDSFKTNDRYNINSFNTFVEAKYSLRLEDNLTIEPKTRLSYYYVSQESINEGHTPGELSIAVDRATSSTADAEVGVDFIKTVYIPSGKIKNILSIGVISTLGSKEKSLDGYVVGNGKNGSKFEIQGIELPQTTGKIAYNIEVEQDKGIIYSAGVNYEFAKDYNRNINVSVGIGYKF